MEKCDNNNNNDKRKISLCSELYACVFWNESSAVSIVQLMALFYFNWIFFENRFNIFAFYWILSFFFIRHFVILYILLFFSWSYVSICFYFFISISILLFSAATPDFLLSSAFAYFSYITHFVYLRFCIKPVCLLCSPSNCANLSLLPPLFGGAVAAADCNLSNFVWWVSEKSAKAKKQTEIITTTTTWQHNSLRRHNNIVSVVLWLIR